MMHVPSAGRLSSLNNQYRGWITAISGESKAWTVQSRNVYPTFSYDVIPSQTNQTTWCLRFQPYVSGSSMGRERYSREQEVEQGVKTKAIARNTWQKEAQDKTPKLNVTIYSNVKAPLPADRFDLASLQLTFFESDLTVAPSDQANSHNYRGSDISLMLVDVNEKGLVGGFRLTSRSGSDFCAVV
ncbi:hypothetical protein QOT17_019918 [Balamuthia mandrillaris]